MSPVRSLPSRSRPPRLRAGARAALGAVLLGAAATAWPQAPAAPALIYTCTDSSGKKITRDRPIAECNAVKQRVLNADGSVHGELGPTLTADEAAQVEDRNRAAQVLAAQQREAEKRDRNLLMRYPNEASHRRAREAALDDPRKALRVSEQRLAALAKERKPLNDEAEFYIGKPLPLKLKLAIDANDASVDAQKSLQQNQKLEIVRIERNFDEELSHLRQLWAGARPGSLGPLASASAPPAAPAR